MNKGKISEDTVDGFENEILECGNRPRLIIEANVSKLPKALTKDCKDKPEPEEGAAVVADEELSDAEKQKIIEAFNHQTSNILMLKFCPIIGNLDYLRKLDKAGVIFTEDPLQWSWTASMTDHNSVVGDGLPIGYLTFIIDQLKAVGYSLISEECLEAPCIDKRSFEKIVYTFGQPALVRKTKKIRM